MVKANVLFIHGDRDQVCPYSSARQAYAELPPSKAFLTFTGADHGGTSWGNTGTVARRTWHDWMRWSLYGDLAARGRLPTDATASATSGSSSPAPMDRARPDPRHGQPGGSTQRQGGRGRRRLHRRRGQLVQRTATAARTSSSSSSTPAAATSASRPATAASSCRSPQHERCQHHPAARHQHSQPAVARHRARGGVVSLINRQSGLAIDVWERSSADGAASPSTPTAAAPTSDSCAGPSDLDGGPPERGRARPSISTDRASSTCRRCRRPSPRRCGLERPARARHRRSPPQPGRAPRPVRPTRRRPR